MSLSGRASSLGTHLSLDRLAVYNRLEIRSQERWCPMILLRVYFLSFRPSHGVYISGFRILRVSHRWVQCLSDQSPAHTLWGVKRCCGGQGQFRYRAELPSGRPRIDFLRYGVSSVAYCVNAHRHVASVFLTVSRREVRLLVLRVCFCLRDR